MIAGRRARKRSLIRSGAMTAAITRTLSSMDGVSAFQRGPSSEPGRISTLPSYTHATSQSEMVMYLRQLATLHGAGILTDEEFSAAQARLMGS
jgi:hypothetical protein